MSLRIESIHVYSLALPLTRPYRVSGGRLYVERMDSVIVALQTDQGLVGWGEACPFGNTYLPAFAAGIHAGIGVIAPDLLGEDPLHIDRINQRMDQSLAGHGYVKSALDMACWDLLGKASGLPLHTLLGGRFSDSGDLLGVFANDTPEAMVADMRGLRAAGYRFFSPKIGGDVALDLDRIRAIRAELRPGETLTLDANRAWLPDQAVQIMNAVDDAGVYFEQPCETLEQCRAVRRLTCQPMILDECIHSFDDLLLAQRDGIAQAINIKIGRVGGLSQARRMRDFCVATGLRMNIEETGGTVIAGTAAIHLAVATPPRFRLASSDSTRLHSVVPASGGYTFIDGRALAPTAPGLGIQVLPEVLGSPVAVYA